MWITVNCCGLLFLKRNLIEITIQRFYKKTGLAAGFPILTFLFACIAYSKKRYF